MFIYVIFYRSFFKFLYMACIICFSCDFISFYFSDYVTMCMTCITNKIYKNMG